jgi:hypothetical protein
LVQFAEGGECFHYIQNPFIFQQRGNNLMLASHGKFRHLYSTLQGSLSTIAYPLYQNCTSRFLCKKFAAFFLQ